VVQHIYFLKTEKFSFEKLMQIVPVIAGFLLDAGQPEPVKVVLGYGTFHRFFVTFTSQLSLSSSSRINRITSSLFFLFSV
jgi:hypothetical protein